MKVHIGADSRTGIVHHASVTAAHVHDSHEVPNLLFGNETRLYGDSAYRGRAQRERLPNPSGNPVEDGIPKFIWLPRMTERQ
jgi:IS5 family transposase